MRLRVVQGQTLLSLLGLLYAGAALSWCVENASPFKLYVNGGYHSDTVKPHFSTVLKPGQVLCAPRDAPRYQGAMLIRHGARGIRFHVTYPEDPENTAAHQKLTRQLSNLGRKTLLRAPIPVAVIPGVPRYKACDVHLPQGDTLIVRARPGAPSPYNKLTGSTPLPKWDCKIAPGDSFIDENEREPTNIAECRVQYHDCAMKARSCRGGDCPTESMCLTESRNCEARVLGPSREAAPGPAPWTLWAAVAGDDVAQLSFVHGMRDSSAARDESLRICRQRNPQRAATCATDHVFQACAALAVQHHGNVTTVGEAATLTAAEATADRLCRERARDSCEIDWSYCADGSGGQKSISHTYGGIARPDDPTGAIALVTDGRYVGEGLTKAIEECRRLNPGRQCRGIVEFATCIAFAEVPHNVETFAWARMESLATAKQAALDHCAKLGNNARCELVVSGCTQAQ